MRKLIALLAVSGVVVSALAQGTVNFNTYSIAFATTADRLVRDRLGAPLLGTDWVAQLYYGSQGTAAGSLVPALGSGGVPVPGRFRAAVGPGTWSGGNRTLGTTGFAAGTTATLQVRVWNMTLFPSYDAAVSARGLTGFSPTFNYTVPAVGSPPSSFYIEGMRGFTLTPEPSTIALGVLGVAGLLSIRRRK